MQYVYETTAKGSILTDSLLDIIYAIIEFPYYRKSAYQFLSRLILIVSVTLSSTAKLGRNCYHSSNHNTLLHRRMSVALNAVENLVKVIIVNRKLLSIEFSEFRTEFFIFIIIIIYSYSYL